MSDSRASSELGYSAEVLEHFHSPRHGGVLKNDDERLCTGCAGAVESGVEVCFALSIDADNTVAEIAWRAYGCPSTLAAASWLAERVRGGSVTDALQLTALQVAEALRVAPARRSRVIIVENALRAALESAVGESGNN